MKLAPSLILAQGLEVLHGGLKLSPPLACQCLNGSLRDARKTRRNIKISGGYVVMLLQVFAVLALGLMCGSELNVAAFAHPTLNRQPREAHIRLRSALAALFGRVMPFWMVGSTLLNLVLVLPFEHLSRPSWRFAAVALAIQIFAVLFSLVAPVPINNRITKWTPESIPGDWREQEHRWDLYHWFRTTGLIVAFALLVVSVGAR